jgi:Leucine-rich repeat (LRR) protein
MIARSLREIASAGRKKQLIERIVLSKSEDLVCNNMMCEKVTLPCICRLEKVLDGVDSPESVLSIDISDNALDCLPPSLAKFTRLQHLDLRGNALTNVPAYLDGVSVTR